MAWVFCLLNGQNEVMQDCFAREQSPIWMDSSTGRECGRLEAAAGGAEALCRLTGSKAYHRFTGNQIAKIAAEEPSVYNDTERISLVSSFACSLFIGRYAAIDASDASGMNLMALHTRDWDDNLLDVCSGHFGHLREKLGDVVKTDTLARNIAPYFHSRYGFPPDCQVVTFTGDNPSSIAGLGLRPKDVAISLGTSDTLFLTITHPNTQLGLHVLANPVEPQHFMAMLCFKNGSLTRERVRRETGCANWAAFEVLLGQTSAGNDGCLGFYYDLPEILPDYPAGVHRFGATGERVQCFERAVEARAALEQGCLAKRSHASALGLESGGRVVVTGGASANLTLLQMLSDVFAAPVAVQEDPNSAALGGALRARQVSAGLSWESMATLVADRAKVVAKPNPEAVKVCHSLFSDVKIRKQMLTFRSMKSF